jgi:two-component system nitrogen regulation sensor histidine kinase NtrY
MPHLNPVPGDINALASETVANFREANPNVDFAISLDSAVPLIPIDREAMKRALVNLLDNAVAAATSVSHNGDRPRIEVRSLCRADNLRADNSVVTLEVADNGPGIDPRLRTRIFEPYYSSKKGGTGLGLAIVSAVVTDHHGLVRVTDNQPCGSRFLLEFPVQSAQFAKATG